MKKTSLKSVFKKNSLAAAIAATVITSPGLLAQELEEITITGSRIRQTDGMTTPVPVTALTTAELQGFEPGGTMAEQLDALPQFFGTQTAQRGGGMLHASGGGSYLDMRSLGANRTLVLFDGSRVVPADKRGSVNIDTFPTALISTVDVVTGGASAAYGADALGGVTNFVLDREFEGLKIQTGTGITEVGDGERWNFSIAGGKQIGDRLNIIGSVQAMHINQIMRNPEDLDAEWFQRWGWVTNPDWVSATATPNVPQRLTLPWVVSSEHSPTGVIWARQGTNSSSPLNPFALNGMTFLEDGSGVRPFIHGDVYAAPNARGTTKSMSGGPEAQIGARAFMSGLEGRETVGRSGFAAAQYEFSDSLTGFGQVMVGRSESIFHTNRTDMLLSDGWFATIYRENAFLPEDIGAAMDEAGIDSFQLHKLGGFLDGGDINDDSTQRGVFTTYSWSVGVDAILPNGWDLRASWQTGRADKRTGIYDEQRIDRVFLGMDAVRDPATGAIVCNVQLYNPTPEQLAATPSIQGMTSSRDPNVPLASPIGLDNTVRDCIPFNIMGTGNLSKAAQDYVTTPKMGISVVDQDFAEVLVQGEVYEGWGYGPISLAAGLTWREQSFRDAAEPAAIDALGPVLNAPELGIRGVPPSFTGASPNLHMNSTVPTVSGAYDVWEWFSEINVPVWESASGQQRVGSSLAFRSSDYSSVGRVDAWKIGVDIEVFEDLRLRATRSRDVREATFSERFDAQGGGGNITDPRFNNTAFQITSVSGGNPNLVPEKANTVVVGGVYQPSWLEGLSLSVDWYDVQIADAVGTLGLQRIVDDCESGAAPVLCNQIERTPSGFIGRVFNVPLNVAQARVNGIDYELSYQMEPDFFDSQSERFNMRMLAGYVRERSNTPYGATSGLNTSGTVDTPDLTGNITAAYGIGPYSVQLQQRYIARSIINANWVEGRDVDINEVASSNITNLRLGYDGEMSSGSTWDVAFNVTNLFDRHPPVQPSYSTRGGAQTVNQNYDMFGRRYQLSLNYNF